MNRLFYFKKKKMQRKLKNGAPASGKSYLEFTRLQFAFTSTAPPCVRRSRNTPAELVISMTVGLLLM
jgi:hypothetical protein